MPSVNFATAFTYLNPVECDICLPPKLVISLVDIPIIGFIEDIFKNELSIYL
jgi:hypothetical protein